MTLIAARNSFMASGRPTAKDYDGQSGRVAMWDGIENVAYEKHQSNPTKWIDLTGNGYDFTAIQGTTLDFGKDHYVSDGSKYLTGTLDKEVSGDIRHIEVVLRMRYLDANAVYETLMCLNAGGLRIAAPTLSPEVQNRGFSFYPEQHLLFIPVTITFRPSLMLLTLESRFQGQEPLCPIL